jgi:DNA-directed RNA polymerase subunit RPC12/RpoP
MDQLFEIENQWRIEAEKAHPEFPDIGNLDATCPYCGHRLERLPSRDRRCPKCGQLIRLTVRPSDRQEVLATKDQDAQIDEQLSILYGRHEEFLAEKKRAVDEGAKLTAQYGRQASDFDVKMSLKSQEAENCGREQNWAMFRQVIRGMGDSCKGASRFKEALALYLTACYLDLVWKRRCNESLAEGRANERKVWGDDPEGSEDQEADWEGCALTVAPQILLRALYT